MKFKPGMQPIRPGARRRDRDQSGFVLLWVIFGFVVMGAVATAALVAASTERRSSKAVSDWGRSLYLAEAGIQEIMATVTDSALDELNPGDSLTFGAQALSQGGSYTGVLHRVDGGGQLLYSLSVRARRRGTLSGVHTLAMLATRPKPPPGSAMAVDGDLLISGNPTFTGTCGGLSVDGRLTVTGQLTIDGDVAAGETVVNGSIVGSDGKKMMERNPPPPEDIPDADETAMADQCDQADVKIEAGQVTVSEPACATLGSCTEAEKLDYYSALDAAPAETKYDLSTEQNYVYTETPGTVCVAGSLVLGGDQGTESNPVSTTVLADGSVEIPGGSYLAADDPDGVLIEAGGDLDLSGPSSLTGDIRVGGQCDISGALTIDGQIVCSGEDPEAGEPDLVTGHEIAGDMSINYDCAGGGGGGGTGATAGVLRPIRNRAWTQRY